ncbi:MAG: hypothetical protein IJ820_05915 [Lachnospiraceae bacterium]|nr:hypothetical protein [Lachnospiraceae bacterium]
MAINPMALMHLKERLSLFQQDRPRVFPFFNMLKEEGLQEGAVYEMKVTLPDGTQRVMNFRLNAHDIETIRLLMKEQQ